ncbi:hypothetical protein TrRE_jg12717, partial [Triparma retinervis]
MAVWLCGPVLSLIDTSAVGVFSGTVQQAALSPAVSIVDYTSLCLAFMFTGTTNLIAGKDTTPESTDSLSPAARVMKSSLQISLRVGVLAMVFMFLTSSRLLKLLIGNSGVDPAVFTAALKYVRIRSLGMPADVIMRSAQAACLGLKDITSPLLVLVAAALVNGMSDAVLVPCKFGLFNGAAGAAWATVFSQYTAVFLYLGWLRKGGTRGKVDVGKKGGGLRRGVGSIIRNKSWRGARRGETSDDYDYDAKVEDDEGRTARHATQPVKKIKFTTRGMLEGKFRKRDLFKPSPDTKDFVPFFVPVTTTQIGRISGYVAMSHAVASSMGTISMAAHQVMLTVFYTLTPIADSLSLTGQSFVPELFDNAASAALQEGFHGGTGSAAAKKLAHYNVKLWQTGLVFGLVMSLMALAVPHLSPLFTADPMVREAIFRIAPYMSLSFVVHGCVCAMEGVMLGTRDLRFLSQGYTAFFFLVPAVMLRIKRQALGGAKGVGPETLWKAFVGYNAVRATIWSLRMVRINWKALKGVGMNCGPKGEDQSCFVPPKNPEAGEGRKLWRLGISGSPTLPSGPYTGVQDVPQVGSPSPGTVPPPGQDYPRGTPGLVVPQGQPGDLADIALEVMAAARINEVKGNEGPGTPNGEVGREGFSKQTAILSIREAFGDDKMEGVVNEFMSTAGGTAGKEPRGGKEEDATGETTEKG